MKIPQTIKLKNLSYCYRPITDFTKFEPAVIKVLTEYQLIKIIFI